MPAAESTPSVAVLDASVAVRWVVPERGSDEAAALLNRPILWVAPRLMLAEAASALRRKVSAGELRAEIAVQALDSLVDAVADGTIVLVQDEAFVASALTLALTLGHKLPDCLYLAVAERDGLSLATADARLERLARQRGVPTYAVLDRLALEPTAGLPYTVVDGESASTRRVGVRRGRIGSMTT